MPKVTERSRSQRVGHHRALVLGEDAALDHAAAAAVLPGSAGVAQDGVVGGDDRGQPLLPLQRLDHQPDAEDRRRGGAAVLAVAAAPAADHPVVPHELAVVARPAVPAADEEVFQVEGAGQRPLRQHLRPELEGGVHDLLVGAGAESGHRVGPRRVDDAPLRQMRLDHAVEAGVERDVREEGLGAGHDRREG